jgi:hypothetical protein
LFQNNINQLQNNVDGVVINTGISDETESPFSPLSKAALEINLIKWKLK